MSPGADFPNWIAGAAEVCWTSTVDGVVDEDCDLELDPLANGKPVEFVPQHRSDMVELPLVRDQPGIEDRLQSSHDRDTSMATGPSPDLASKTKLKLISG